MIYKYRYKNKVSGEIRLTNEKLDCSSWELVKVYNQNNASMKGAKNVIKK